MVPLVLIMFAEVGQSAAQRGFTENNQLGQAFAFDRTYPPPRKRIEIWTAWRKSQALRAARCQGLAEFSADLPRPEQTKALPVPSDDRLGLDDDQKGSPVGPNPPQPKPEDSVGGRQLHSFRS